MTLQNGAVIGSSAYVWTDSAFWDPATGELLGHAPKALVSLTWPYAGVLSVCGSPPQTIVEAIGLAEPQDVPELLAASVAALRAYCLRGGFGRVLLATNLDRPRLFMVASDGAGIGAAFEPIELLSFASSGNDASEWRCGLERGFTRSRMRRVIDAQIREGFGGEGKLAGLGRRSWIGGEIIEVEVSCSGVRNRVVRTV